MDINPRIVIIMLIIWLNLKMILHAIFLRQVNQVQDRLDSMLHATLEQFYERIAESDSFVD